VRKEFQRLRYRYLALQTIARHGTPELEEGEQVKQKLKAVFGSSALDSEMSDVESAGDAGARLDRPQRHNTAIRPIDQRLTRVTITEPISGSSQSVLTTQATAMATPSLSRCKHKLGDPVPLADPAPELEAKAEESLTMTEV
jgi:hypothetical protein